MGRVRRQLAIAPPKVKCYYCKAKHTPSFTTTIEGQFACVCKGCMKKFWRQQQKETGRKQRWLRHHWEGFPSGREDGYKMCRFCGLVKTRGNDKEDCLGYKRERRRPLALTT
jgi:hypothetical protein